MLNTIEARTFIDPLMKRGFGFYEAGNNMAAAKIFEIAYRRDPSTPIAALNMGAAYYKAKHYPEAEDAYQEVLKNDPNNADAHYGIAMINEEIGDRLTARVHFQKAAELNPSSGKMWLSLAQTTCEETPRNQALKRAVDAAIAELQKKESSFLVTLQCGDILLKAGEYTEALKAYKLATSQNSSSAKALSELSMCYFLMKNYRAAADTNREKIMRCTPEAHFTKQSQKFVKTAQAALIEIHKTLKAVEVPFFLVAGTLLGCIRDKTPLAHDRDVDIGVPEKVSNKTIIEALRANSEFSCPLYYTEDDMYLCISHHKFGIDIFRHERSGNHIWCGFSRNLGDMKWRYTPFSLREKIILGLPFLIPDNTELYLRENYGSWEKTDKAFSSVLSSPARYDVDEDILRFLSHSRMWLIAHKKDVDLTRRLIAQTPPIVKNDLDLINRILEITQLH